MATAWLTYAWADNNEGDVDFFASELKRSGLTVNQDRFVLKSGARLWDQIASQICEPSKCDALLWYLTPQSLSSQACLEEYAYALDRALAIRGNDFPIIGILPTTIDRESLPAGIRTRVYVSLCDPNWKERVLAAVERRQLAIANEETHPYFVKLHSTPNAFKPFFIEMRPRVGTWSPFAVAIPSAEKDAVNPNLAFGPKGIIPTGAVLYSAGSDMSRDGDWWINYASNEASPTQSYYLACDQVPTEIAFGKQVGTAYSLNQVGFPAALELNAVAIALAKLKESKDAAQTVTPA